MLMNKKRFHNNQEENENYDFKSEDHNPFSMKTEPLSKKMKSFPTFSYSMIDSSPSPSPSPFKRQYSSIEDEAESSLLNFSEKRLKVISESKDSFIVPPLESNSIHYLSPSLPSSINIMLNKREGYITNLDIQHCNDRLYDNTRPDPTGLELVIYNTDNLIFPMNINNNKNENIHAIDINNIHAIDINNIHAIQDINAQKEKYPKEEIETKSCMIPLD